MILLYDYVDDARVNQIAAWSRGLQPEERARLRSKLKTLERVDDPNQLPRFVVGPIDPVYPEIRKLQIGATGSKTALRPMVCRGPFDKNAEVTLLAGAKEVGGKLLPKGITGEAHSRRDAIVNDQTRRCSHEWIE
jgi:hypothetical protein